MNLLTVLESKEDFTRPGKRVYRADETDRTWTTEDVLSEEWYVIKQEVTITREDFYLAVADTMKEVGMTFFGPYGNRRPMPGDLMEFKDWKLLTKRLGFK